jgi:hypothetical protein
MRYLQALASVLAALAALSVLAPSASAKPCRGGSNVPPGQSEVDQYTETVPRDCGNQQTPSPDEGTSLGSIPSGTVDALEAQGADGRAAALLAGASADAGGSGGGSGNGRSGAQPGALPPALDAPAAVDTDEGPVIEPILDALRGEGGMGIVLPLLLIVVIAASIGYWLHRRRMAA